MILQALGDGEDHWPEEIQARAARDWGLTADQLAEKKPGFNGRSQKRWVQDVAQVLAHRKDLIEGRSPGPYRLTEQGVRDLAKQRTGAHRAEPKYTIPHIHWLSREKFAADQLAVAAIVLAVLSLGAGAFLGVLARGRSAKRQTAHTNLAASRPLPSLPLGVSLVANAQPKSVAVYPSPGAPRPIGHLSNPNEDRAPLTFLVKATSPGWYEVYLPSRPNGSVGWIQQSPVRLADDPYRVQVDLRAHHLIAWHEDQVIMSAPVGVGEAVSPTPPGLYYITELLKQSDPYGPYGPYAFGLSVHSQIAEIQEEFPASGGRIGLHGTDDPYALGTDVSHGCIRLSNDNIVKLAHLLPAGTPVLIKASGGGNTFFASPPSAVSLPLTWASL